MTTPTSGRTLILVRHAKAEHVQGKPDHDRELSSRGRRDARAIGRWLRDAPPGLVLDLALCSTSERTRQTLDEICTAEALVKDVRYDERIYGAGTTALLHVLREVPDSANSVLMIGHAPGIPEVATLLARDEQASTDAGSTDLGSADAADRLSRGFPTSGIAVLGFESRWSKLARETAYLREFVVPRG